jgi:hypothetical protein
MKLIRRYMRVYAAAWLVFQAVSFSTLVPRDCCAAHRPVEPKAETACHDAAPSPPVMHGGHAGHHAVTPENDTDTCKLRGACDGPMAGFIAQLSLQGVLSDPFQFAPSMIAGGLDVPAREHLISRLVPPDSPPPRA